MSRIHAVLHLSRDAHTILKDSFLPRLDLSDRPDLNTLWIRNGQFSGDVIATGPVDSYTLRQLRGHGFIFIGTRGARIRTKTCAVQPDIILTKNMTTKQAETKIGEIRTRMRRVFGNALRQYASRLCTVFHGSEVETLVAMDPLTVEVCGLPKRPPVGTSRSRISYTHDSGVDEKLVSMLDYALFGFRTVIYVGSGDGRTIKRFFQQHPKRAASLRWICIDPIQPVYTKHVLHYREEITHPAQLQRFRSHDPTIMLWDVRSDRGELDDLGWEELTAREDALGRRVALENREWLNAALLKTRVPFSDFTIETSELLFQPGAPAEMYEVRNWLQLDGPGLRRDWLGPPRELVVDRAWLVEGCQRLHGRDRGRRMKTEMIAYLHIKRMNGLDDTRVGQRADLFYLTNAQNPAELVEEAISRSTVCTLWAAGDPTYDYDDWVYDPRLAMLKHSTQERMVLDGLGFMLFGMWQGWIEETLSFDPWWAANFIVIFPRSRFPPVPDVSLCRFVGLRTASSHLRIREFDAHAKADLVKSTGLDLSGHLYVTLHTGWYTCDLVWWFNMILEWSVQDADSKRRDLDAAGAQVLEWKEDRASDPWHLRCDLVAALRIYQEREERRSPYLASLVTPWVEKLRTGAGAP
ncbi:capping enzyme [Chobar Gorge virus]|uniref:Core protein VP4 n=1 Tax=Chobar Gorge virus TaxID=1679172 RepID=A0A0H4M5E8_9REOV|nr:capping enzyme [Chobar Gorge virus]AKP24099.1 capping enzyme [Chobar Gorge virus]